MKLYALFALALGAGLWSDVDAAPTRAVACNACSPMQEEQKALAAQGRGYIFVYNVAGNRIRKFEILVFAGSGNGMSPIDTKRGGTRIVSTTEPPEGAAPDAAGTVIRELWEDAVDPGVQEIFDSIVTVERQAPGFIEGKNEYVVPIRNIGLTVGTIGPRPFDPRGIAWSAGGGGTNEYDLFMDQLNDRLNSSSSAYAISPLVGRALYSIFFRLSSVSISFSGGGFGLGISFERLSSPIKLKLCDDEGNCVTVSVKMEDGVAKITYEKTNDKYGARLPVEAPSVSTRWPSNGREGANAYAQWLRRTNAARDILGGNQYGCGSYVLACTRIEGTTMLACQIHCY